MSTGGDKNGTIMAQLRSRTQELHAQLEALPYFETLTKHALPLDCYVNQLRALAVIHGVLEHELGTCSDELVCLVWDDGYRKLALLEKDLLFFNPRIAKQSQEGIEPAMQLAEKIRLRKMQEPVSLLGFLYVFEGATLGNSMHCPDVITTFHLKGKDGYRYYAGYPDNVHERWKIFSTRMNGAVTDASLVRPVVEAAAEAFSGLEKLYVELYPRKEKTLSYHVTQINPEAGNHPIPDDRKEIDAALKASRRAWEEFGYYEARYGMRGKRFADSDTCWLATLVNLDEQALRGQVEWLCRVLATRGMPSLMMEYTLKALYEELAAAVPEREIVYRKLFKAGQHIENSRELLLPEEDVARLSGSFEATVGTEMAAVSKTMGRLLAAAVADEANGLTESLGAIEPWATEKNRFSECWIDAVSCTIQEARRLCAGRNHTCVQE